MSNNRRAGRVFKNLTIRIIAAAVVGVGIIASLHGCSPPVPSPGPVKPELGKLVPAPLVEGLLAKDISHIGFFGPGGEEVGRVSLFPGTSTEPAHCEDCTKISPGDPDYSDRVDSKADEIFDAFVNPAEAAACYPPCTNCGKPSCRKSGGWCCPCP